MAVIDDPAVAVAAADCVSSRSIGRLTARHPRPCQWCDYPLDELRRMVEGFVVWAKPKDRGNATVYDRHDAQVFAELARKDPAKADQLVADARGEAPAPPPPPLAPPTPVSTEEDDDAMRWL